MAKEEKKESYKSFEELECRTMAATQMTEEDLERVVKVVRSCCKEGKRK